MIRPRKPRIHTDDVYREISLRSSVPTNVVKNVVRNYIEIITQCIENEVIIPFGGIGVFEPIREKPHDYTEFRAFLNDEPIVFFRKNTDGFVRFKFKPYDRYKKLIREHTYIPYGSIESDKGVEYRRMPHLRRVDYEQYLKDTNLEKYEEQFGRRDKFQQIPEATPQEYDEYDMLFSDDDNEEIDDNDNEIEEE